MSILGETLTHDPLLINQLEEPISKVLLMICVLELIMELQKDGNINQEAKEGVK